MVTMHANTANFFAWGKRLQVFNIKQINVYYMFLTCACYIISIKFKRRNISLLRNTVNIF